MVLGSVASDFQEKRGDDGNENGREGRAFYRCNGSVILCEGRRRFEGLSWTSNGMGTNAVSGVGFLSLCVREPNVVRRGIMLRVLSSAGS
ncbi:hypothetical protein MRB53_033604 [Persea americana]|uniref:Uncharacterized protein n=1 Tax=Persea americana TaxID=3435 RepID=A0ACC2KV06_PERAE|nr:hypothetical protein MRB53_033604 [Persea americana]